MGWLEPPNCPSKRSTTQYQASCVQHQPVTRMAPTTFSAETAEGSLREEGYVNLHDSGAGAYVSEIQQRGFQYLSPHGLESCQQRVLEDVVNRSTPYNENI